MGYKIVFYFLITMVKKPDEDDWVKLKRVLKYFTITMHMKFNLTVYLIYILKL